MSTELNSVQKSWLANFRDNTHTFILVGYITQWVNERFIHFDYLNPILVTYLTALLAIYLYTLKSLPISYGSSSKKLWNSVGFFLKLALLLAMLAIAVLRTHNLFS